MCKLKFYWFKIWMKTYDKTWKETTRIEIISKSKTQRWKNFLKFKQFTFLRLEADSNLSTPNVLCRNWTCAKHFTLKWLWDFARNKITVDVGCVHMLTYSARVWRRLRALWRYNELGLTNHSVCLNVAIL